MANIVIKFGGTSVKNAQAIRNIAHIIKSDKRIRIVVVSAIAGITNQLVTFCHASTTERTPLLKLIRKRHLDLAHTLGLSLNNEINFFINKLEGILQSTPLDAEQIDQVISCGEDLSSRIVHAFLVSQGIRITHIDIRHYMITDNCFGNATPNLDAIKQQLKSLPNRLCITQGFIGCTNQGKTTTLGRGGSDYSAAILAEAIQAPALMIYTDVPGVYTMDPAMAANAHLIETLSFQEMAEMANFGAKILHPATLEPCIRANIPVRILSTFSPNQKGTLIHNRQTTRSSPTVSAVTIRNQQVLVTIKSLKMLNAYGFLAQVFAILAKHKISIDLITTSEVSVALTIDCTSLGSHGLNPFMHNMTLIQELEQFADIVIEHNLSLLAIIGNGLTAPGIIQTKLEVIKNHPIRLICYGASQASIGILVPKKDVVQMAQKIHQAFLENAYVC